MSNEKEDLAVNSISSSIGNFCHKAPAIMITERNGDDEKVLEFATAEDYAAYKRIEAEPLITDKQKYDAAVKRSCEAVRKAVDDLSSHGYLGAISK